MKNILYVLLVIFISEISNFAFSMSNEKMGETIVLSCKEQKTDILLLKKSADIIEKRLDDIGLENFVITISENESKIIIDFKNDLDYSKINELVTAKGEVRLCELWSRSEFVKYFELNSEISEMLNLIGSGELIADDYCLGIVANVDSYNISIINNYFIPFEDSLRKRGFELAWSVFSDSYQKLFLLNTDTEILWNYIQDSKVSYEKEYQRTNILFSFNNEGVGLWEDLTKRSIGRPVAVVIDGMVYSAPVVQSVIKGGNCQMSGDFTVEEASCLSAIINNGAMPLEFIVEK
jgi:hypothetical protein